MSITAPVNTAQIVDPEGRVGSGKRPFMLGWVAHSIGSTFGQISESTDGYVGEQLAALSESDTVTSTGLARLRTGQDRDGALHACRSASSQRKFR